MFYCFLLPLFFSSSVDILIINIYKFNKSQIILSNKSYNNLRINNFIKKLIN